MGDDEVARGAYDANAATASHAGQIVVTLQSDTDTIEKKTLMEILSGASTKTKEALLKHYLKKSTEYSNKASEIKAIPPKGADVRASIRKGEVISYREMAEEMNGHPLSAMLFGLSPEMQKELYTYFDSRHAEYLKPGHKDVTKTAIAKDSTLDKHFRLVGRGNPYRDAADQIEKLILPERKREFAERGLDSLSVSARRGEFRGPDWEKQQNIHKKAPERRTKGISGLF